MAGDYTVKDINDKLREALERLLHTTGDLYRQTDGSIDKPEVSEYFQATAGLASCCHDENFLAWFDSQEPADKQLYLDAALSIY